MSDTSITPSIKVTIGRQTRLYRTFVTTAPAALDAPSTLTLYTGPLKDVAGQAVDDHAFDAAKAATPSRLCARRQHGARMPALALSGAGAPAHARRSDLARLQHLAVVAWQWLQIPAPAHA